MILKLKWNHLVALTLLLLFLLSGCGGQAPGPGTLRIAVLPILDTLPMYVAEAEGYFAQAGVEIEFVTAASAAERDQLLQAGQVDGFITDLVALALYNRDASRVLAVRYAMVPTPDYPQFRVMAAAQSGINTVDALRGVPIGVSEGTVIEYVTHRILEAEGLSRAEIATVAVPKIPDRMALLSSGEISAATLPEPLASLAIRQGAVVVVDDTQHPESSCSIYAFRKAVLDTQPGTVQGFLAAVDRASALINADKAHWNALLTEHNLVPAPLVGNYALPDYPGNAVPTEAQFADVLAWLEETGRLPSGPAYEEVVDDALLPGVSFYRIRPALGMLPIAAVIVTRKDATERRCAFQGRWGSHSSATESGCVAGKIKIKKNTAPKYSPILPPSVCAENGDVTTIFSQVTV